jgi:hypothetical protein
VEFPFGGLQYQHSERTKTLCFSDSITGKDGRIVERRWTVTGSDAHGLPVAGDVDIVIALLALAQEQGLKSREILFTRYDLLRIMRWDNRGHNYTRVKQGLDRLVGTTIKAERAFYDREKQAYLTRAFHLIDDYDLWDRAEGGANAEPDRLPLKSVATWNRHIFKSLKTGYVKRLDMDRYFRLSTPIARQLFRYLDKKFYRDRHFQIDIFKLCHEHIGISRGCRHVSKLKERLTPALDELVRDGYLDSFHYAPSSTKRRSLTLQVVRRATRNESLAPTSAAYFYQQLHRQANVRRPIPTTERDRTERFVQRHGLDVFREFVDYVMREKAQRWPDLATLTGAFNAFEDPFLFQLEDRQRRQEEAQRERHARTAAQRNREEYEDYIEPLIESMKRRKPEQFAAFEQQLEALPEYRRLLGRIDKHDPQVGPLSKAACELAEQERRDLFNRLFARTFREWGVMDFDTWKASQNSVSSDFNRQAS